MRISNDQIEEKEDPNSFPFFKGAARVPTYFGVPIWPLMFAIFIVALIAMNLSLWWWFSMPFVWAIMAAITKTDDRAFRIWSLFIDTKLRNFRYLKLWGASSYSPVYYRQKNE